jgi:hypothetical protein
MGFLDKAMKVAAQAKDQFDDVRESREAASVKPVEGGPLDDHERQVLENAMAHGAPNPFALLTRLEASEVVGAPVGDPSLTYSDDAVGAKFQAHGRGNKYWEVSFLVVHGMEGYSLDAPTYWQDMIADHHSPPEGTLVSGLGEQAIHSGSYLYVLAPPHIFYVEVRTPEGEAGGEALTAVARLILPRLIEQP